MFYFLVKNYIKFKFCSRCASLQTFPNTWITEDVWNICLHFCNLLSAKNKVKWLITLGSYCYVYIDIYFVKTHTLLRLFNIQIPIVYIVVDVRKTLSGWVGYTYLLLLVKSFGEYISVKKTLYFLILSPQD